MMAFPLSFSLLFAILGLSGLIGGTFWFGIRPQTTKALRQELMAGATLVPLGGALLYFLLGNPDYPDQPFLTRSQEVVQKAPESTLPDEPSLEEIIAQIREKLPTVAGTPQETMGWMMLARTYDRQGDRENAQESYRHALEKVKNPQMKRKLAIEYIVFLQKGNEGHLDAEARLVLEGLLSENPQDSEIQTILKDPENAFLEGKSR